MEPPTAARDFLPNGVLRKCVSHSKADISPAWDVAPPCLLLLLRKGLGRRNWGDLEAVLNFVLCGFSH